MESKTADRVESLVGVAVVGDVEGRGREAESGAKSEQTLIDNRLTRKQYKIGVCVLLYY